MMTLDTMTGPQAETTILRTAAVTADRATLSDGGTYFVTLTRADLAEILAEMDEEHYRDADIHAPILWPTVRTGANYAA